MVTNPLWRPQRIGHVLKLQSGWHELREPGLQLTCHKNDRDAIDNLEREADRCSEDPTSGPRLLADTNSAASLVDVQRLAGGQSDLHATSTLLTLGDWHTLRLTAVSAGEPSGQGCPPGGPVAAGPPVLMAERSMPAARHTADCILGRECSVSRSTCTAAAARCRCCAAADASQHLLCLMCICFGDVRTASSRAHVRQPAYTPLLGERRQDESGAAAAAAAGC